MKGYDLTAVKDTYHEYVNDGDMLKLIETTDGKWVLPEGVIERNEKGKFNHLESDIKSYPLIDFVPKTSN